MPSEPATAKLAEVIAATSTAFTAQCYRLYDAPPLGALVRAGETSCVYAVVGNVATGPLDPGRRVLPRGEAEESEDEVYDSNPQLEHLLATTLEAVIVGYEEAGSPFPFREGGEGGRSVAQPRHGLPPLPPRVHAFVSVCSHEETARFAQRFDFLRLLLRAPLSAADEVVAACLRQAGAARRARAASGGAATTDRAYLLQAGRFLAAELGGDTHRLTTLLKALNV
ncbi:MAG: hypothetical protein EXR47_05855 [Dehalococcoidia bacterium]|nr:hypothetical protein [Dehalococcoidia bacterium]